MTAKELLRMSGLIKISVGFLYVFIKHVLAFYPYLCKIRFDLVHISLDCEIKKMCLDTVFFSNFIHIIVILHHNPNNTNTYSSNKLHVYFLFIFWNRKKEFC